MTYDPGGHGSGVSQGLGFSAGLHTLRGYGLGRVSGRVVGRDPGGSSVLRRAPAGVAAAFHAFLALGSTSILSLLVVEKEPRAFY